MDIETLRKLRTLAIAAYLKIHKNLYKDTKWDPAGFSPDGERLWKRCSVAFLKDKLLEEVGELERATDAIANDEPPEAGHDPFWEGADVNAMTMMMVDRVGMFGNDNLQPWVVCLCGSTKFKETFMEMNFLETMAGRIVLSVGFFAHAEKEKYDLSPYEKEKLDELHLRKIDLADEIFVLNVGGYIGQSTKREIEYATKTGKHVRYLEPPNQDG